MVSFLKSERFNRSQGNEFATQEKNLKKRGEKGRAALFGEDASVARRSQSSDFGNYYECSILL